MEKENIRRYLLYSIGEIILVMIGILLYNEDCIPITYVILNKLGFGIDEEVEENWMFTSILYIVVLIKKNYLKKHKTAIAAKGSLASQILQPATSFM